MIARMMSLAVTRPAPGAVDGDAHVLGLRWISVWVASTCSTSEVPIAVGQRPEGAMRRGVAVAAHDGLARQGEALLRSDDVDDALAPVEGVVELDAEIAHVLSERLQLGAALRILDALAAVEVCTL